MSACESKSEKLLTSILSLLEASKFKAMISFSILDVWLDAAYLHGMTIDISEV